ncbi:MAG: cytidylate kinase [Deltaproteobacteria bacterium RIFCSPHIGHO2_12_FULL_43_9]|nr:MAG: cytidylate kinase [Deltaproteobacteria bacterium RIFCSPHIGHO2_12_FULL_43_9]
MKRIRISIDGPAGAGKSTVARALANKLSYVYLDTGALYRTVALAAKKEGISMDDSRRLGELARRVKIRLVREGNIEFVELDGKRIGQEIRTPELGRVASQISKVSGVRQALLSLQRDLASSGGVVMEGRDIGSVVLPDAELKFFLVASFKERAKRRWKELVERGEKVELSLIEDEVQKRDKVDSEREVSPLIKPKGAIEIDTTDLTIDEIVARMYRFAKERESAGA